MVSFNGNDRVSLRIKEVSKFVIIIFKDNLYVLIFNFDSDSFTCTPRSLKYDSLFAAMIMKFIQNAIFLVLF